MSEFSLAARLPMFGRARGFHLYDLKGRRYLDLWQEDGAFFLGRRPERVSREVKALWDKGLGGGLPSVYVHRAQKLLERTFAGLGPFAVFSGRESLRSALGALPVRELYPLASAPGPGPFELGLPLAGLPLAVASLGRRGEGGGVDDDVDFGSSRAFGEPVAAWAAGALVKVVSLWGAWLRGEWETGRAEERWSLLDGVSAHGWQRRGPWLYPPGLSEAAAGLYGGSDPENFRRSYEKLFLGFLDRGFVLSPRGKPSLIPDAITTGEAKQFVKAAAEVPWNS